jgi:TolA-binding protein
MKKIIKNRTTKIKLCLLAATLIFGIGDTFAAKAKKTVKIAPSQEDHAAFFSSPKTDTTEEKLKMADDLRLKTIVSINNLLKSKVNSSNEFELYLRLGELYLERHDYLRGREVENFTRSYDAWKQSKKGSEPKISHSKSRAELMNASAAFRKLITKYPRHARSDAALFELGKTLGRLDNDNAELYFKQLIKQHPNSPLIPAAHLALGEYYFDKHKITPAIQSYKDAMKYKNSDVYTYAVYKLGWSYYNADARNDRETADNLNKSLASFKLVVSLCSKSSTKKSMDLRKEAINDLVMVWAETQGVEDAWAYFSRLGEKQSFYDMLEKLGGIYVEQGKNEKAVHTYTRLLTESPLRPNNPEIHVKLLDLHYQINRENDVYLDLKNMASLYAGANGAWTRANAKDKKLTDEAVERTQRNMHRYGALYHQKGQKYKNDEQLRAASKIYQLYLATFPKTEQSYEIRFYLADILTHFKNYEAASDEYLKVAAQKPDKSGKFFVDSALNAVVSITSLDEATKYPALPPAGKVPAPMEIPRVKKKLISVIETYLKYLPAEKAGHKMRYTVAQTYFDYGHYKVSLQKFTDIAMQLPETEQGKSAVKVVVTFYGQRKDWDNLIASSRLFLKSGKISDKKLNEALVDSIKLGVYSKAAELELAKKYKASAELFLAFQKEFPTDKNADRALYNASLSFYKISAVDRALTTSRLLIDQYPSSELVPNVNIDTAQAYEGLANYEQAAEFYERFFRKFPADKRAATSLYNAIALNRGLKKYAKAIELSQTFIRFYPKHEFVSSLYYDMAGLLEKEKNYRGAITALHDYQNRLANQNSDEYLGASARIAQLTAEHVNEDKGEAMIRKLVSQLVKNNKQPAYEARRIVAETIFKNAETSFNNFKNLKIVDAKKLEREVKAKQERLVSLAKRYKYIVDIGSGEYMVASLYRVGEAHEIFADDLLNVAPPAGSTQVQIDDFKTAIEKVAFPLKDEAFKYYEAAYKQSQEVSAFTEWTKIAHNKMTELDPTKHSKILEKTSSPRYLEHDLRWDEELASYIGDK